MCVWKGGKYGVDASELGIEFVGYLHCRVYGGGEVWRCGNMEVWELEVAPEYESMSVWRYEWMEV